MVAGGRIILEIADQNLLDEPIKNYLWVERIIGNFTHFRDTNLQGNRNPNNINNNIDNNNNINIISVNDPFLLDIQKAIYQLTEGMRTIVNVMWEKGRKISPLLHRVH